MEMRKLLIVAVLGMGSAGWAAPRFDQGRLSDPASGSPEAIARAFLARRSDLVAGGDLLLERRRGGLVRFRRQIAGVPVVGGVVAVSVDAQGRVRWAASDGGEVPPSLSLAPTLPASDAARAASGYAYDDPALARLVVWAPPGQRARLAWDVRLPFDMGERAAWRVVVDAADGRQLYRQNKTLTAKRAKVFASGNPVTVGLTEVTLPLPDNAVNLANADIVALNCIDMKTCPVLQTPVHYRACEIQPKATADGNGDFLYDRPTADTDPEDAFSEVQMFYHAARVLEKFRGLGLPNLRQVPLRVIVNWRQPDSGKEACTGTTSTALLNPFDNAFFTGGAIYHGFPDQPSIIFGQGVQVDYAYDGDVVYHEFTHAVQDVLYDTASGFTDQYGLDTSGGGMTEGTADYFSSSITGDPKVGEYAGADVGFIRDLGGTKKCPDDVTGEPHDDSEPFSSALWDARVALPAADRDAFDQAVYDALDAFGDFESFDTARQKVIAQTQTILGATAAGTVTDRLAARGLAGCNHRVIDLPLGSPKGFLWMTGTGSFSSAIPQVPSAVQFRVNLSIPADKLFVAVAKRGASGASSLNVILKPGNDPILWDPDTVTNDGTRTVLYPVVTNKVVEIPGPFPAGPMAVQLANPSAGIILLLDLIIYTEKEGTPPPVVPDAGVGATGDGGGCCQVGGGAGRASGAALLVLATLVLVRRRRRVTRP